MALRRGLARLSFVALALCAAAGCKGKPSGGDKAAPAGSMTLDERCAQLANVCGDNEKHIQKLLDECRAAAPQAVAKGCVDQTRAAYDCLQKELCGKGDKIWTLDDLRVLSDRSGKCVSERTAAHACGGF